MTKKYELGLCVMFLTETASKSISFIKLQRGVEEIKVSFHENKSS